MTGYPEPLRTPADAVLPIADRGVARGSGISASSLLASILLYLAGSELLLLRFLGLSSPGLLLPLGAVLGALCIAAAKPMAAVVPARRVAGCVLIAATVLMLGGEGHAFYANVDWQVRDAVLADMIRWPWPFGYTGDSAVRVLRAPVGMYLVPALVGKGWGIAAAHVALLAQNAALLAALLALGSLLFDTARARRIAACVVIGFSGMDTLGALLARRDTLWPFDVHIETWAPIQFSSMLTDAFWVPQHAIVGWLGALFFLLWRRGTMPLHAFLSAMPLCLLWSPLGVMGTLPFALIAAGEAVIRRAIRSRDVALPIAAALLAVPSLAYLAADAGRVGAHLIAPDPATYLVFEMVEVIPILVLATTLGGAATFGRATLVTVAVCLAAFPFLAIGENDDFTMRASIPALLILALTAADRLAESRDNPRRVVLVLVLAIGALTPAREAYRALIYRPTPFPRCDLAAAWRESFAMFGTNTYFARASSLPGPMRMPPAGLAPPSTVRCYDRPWKSPRWSVIPVPAAIPGVIA